MKMEQAEFCKAEKPSRRAPSAKDNVIQDRLEEGERVCLF